MGLFLLQVFLTALHFVLEFTKRSTNQRNQFNFKENSMLHYTVVFFIIAIIAGIFGFGGIAAGAAGIAKILFVIFLVLALISLVRGRKL